MEIIELQTSEKCSTYEKAFFEKLLSCTANEVELSSALLNLSQMLHEHHDIAPIIIIDEYDTPIQQGHLKGFYDDVVSFMRNLFSGGLKDNRHLSYGFMTGILRVAKESIFSGLNNLKINSILDKKYSSYFGLTAEEVREMVYTMAYLKSIMKSVNGTTAIVSVRQKFSIRGLLSIISAMTVSPAHTGSPQAATISSVRFWKKPTKPFTKSSTPFYRENPSSPISTQV